MAYMNEAHGEAYITIINSIILKQSLELPCKEVLVEAIFTGFITICGALPIQF